MRSGSTLLAGAAAALSVALGATGASANVVTSLPGGTVETMPITQYSGSGPVTFGADNLTWTSSVSSSVEGYNAGYSFIANSAWLGGDGMIGLNSPVGTMDVTFSHAVSGVVADIDWAEPHQSDNLAISLTAYNAANQVIDTITFDSGSGSNLVAPGIWGFEDATADISRLEFSNGYIGARDFSIATDAVPEPATWAMMLVGIGGLGSGLRRRRRASLAA